MSMLNTAVLKLAVDSVNLGLCDSRDYSAFPSLIDPHIAPTNFNSNFSERELLINSVTYSVIRFVSFMGMSRANF